jgi:hypothetical protein
MMYVPNHWSKVALRRLRAGADSAKNLFFLPEQRSGEPWAACHGEVKFL